MKKVLIPALTLLSLTAFTTAGIADSHGGKIDGKKEFEKHCASCHPKGGNVINAKMTLNKADMQANKVKTAKDIIKLMRKPGPGMPAFDAKTISDKEAKAIANYILENFK